RLATALVLRTCPTAGLRLSLGRAVTAGRTCITRRLQDLQPVLGFQGPSRHLCTPEVLMGERFGAILSDQIHCDVNVVVAVLRQPVSHRYPPTRRLSALVVVELHPADEVARDLSPRF